MSKEAPKVIFRKNSEGLNLTQNGEITFSAMTQAEEAIVRSIVTWNEPHRFQENVYDVAGRSIFVKSPDRIDSPENNVAGQFAGLQLIGAGGSIDQVFQGLRLAVSQLTISPVNAADHEKQLHSVTEKRTINDEGKVLAKNSGYTPLGGMTREEAAKRKERVIEWRESVEPFLAIGKTPPFLVPELAGEGVFNDKLDPNGNKLCFQVYRVPLLSRLPGQILQLSQDHSIQTGIDALSEANYSTGYALANWHRNEEAYMEPHVGNTSYLSRNPGVIYLTDFGDSYDFSEEKPRIKTAYKALDIFIALKSQKILVDSLLGAWGGLIESGQADDLFVPDTTMFLIGYIKMLNNNVPPNPHSVLALVRRYKNYIYQNKYQKFVSEFPLDIKQFIKDY